MPSMNFRKRIVLPALVLGCALSTTDALAQAPRPSDETLHNELRTLKDRAVAAVNKRDPDALMKELDPNIAFTAMNNEVVHGIAEAKAYYQRMLVGAGRVLEDMSLSAEADRPADLYENGTVAVATGTSNAHFKLTAGPEFDMPLRWSATLRRANDKWAIAGMHFSANIFDNPLLSGMERSIKWVGVITGIVALVGGFLLGRWSRRASVKSA